MIIPQTVIESRLDLIFPATFHEEGYDILLIA